MAVTDQSSVTFKDTVIDDFLKGYLLTRILDAIYRSVKADFLATITMNASFLHHSSVLEIALESELAEFLSSDCIDRMCNVLSSKPSLMKPKLPEDAFTTRSTSYNLVHDDFYFAPLAFYTIKTVLCLIYLGIFTGLSIHGCIFDDEWICMFGFIFNEVFQLGDLGVKGHFEACENYLDFSLSFLFLSVMLLCIAGNFYVHAENARSIALYIKKNININALNGAGITFALVSSSHGKYKYRICQRSLKRNNTFDGESNETLPRQWRCHNPKCLRLTNYSITANAPETQKIFQCSLCEMEHHCGEYIKKMSRKTFTQTTFLSLWWFTERSTRILMNILGCFIIIKKYEVSIGSWFATFGNMTILFSVTLDLVFLIYSSLLVYLLTQHKYAEAEGVDVIIVSLCLFCNIFAVIDLSTPTYSTIMFNRYSIDIFGGSGMGLCLV